VIQIAPLRMSQPRNQNQTIKSQLTGLLSEKEKEKSHDSSSADHSIRLLLISVCYSVLHCVAVCCSVLQCVAAYCSVLQRVAACSSVLQCVIFCNYGVASISRLLKITCLFCRISSFL